MRRRLSSAGICALSAFVHIAASAVSSVINIMLGLNVIGVSRSVALAASVVALAVYILGVILVNFRRSAELSGFGVAFWGVTLLGFIFYAAFNILGTPISIPIPNMTAFLRAMMLLFTVPLLAVDSLIGLIPAVWMRLCVTLAVPAALFGFNLFIRISRAVQKKNKGKTVRAVNEAPDYKIPRNR